MKSRVAVFIFGVILLGFSLVVSVPQTRMFLLLLSMIPLLSVFMAGLIPHWIHIERDEKEIGINRFKPFTIEFSVRNTSPFPIPPFMIYDKTDNIYTREKPVFLTRLRPFEKKTFRYTAEGNERGLYTFGPIECSGKDSMGFFSWKKGSHQTVKALIYPASVPVFFTDTGGRPGGSIKSRSPINEDPTRYEAIRPYREGDNLKRINWKASARMNRLMTTEYEASLHLPVTIFLNFNEQDYATRFRYDMMEKGVEAAASLVLDYSQKKQPVRLVTNGTIPGTNGQPVQLVSPQGSDYQLPLLRTLALLKPAVNPRSFRDLILSQKSFLHQGRAFLITPFLQQETYFKLLENWGKSGKALFLHLADFDTQLQEDRFTGLRGMKSLIIKSRAKEVLHDR